MVCAFFFFNDTATTEIYTLSLHDALPISLATARAVADKEWGGAALTRNGRSASVTARTPGWRARSGAFSAGTRASRPSTIEIGEHTSELQSRQYLVCRLLLEKKKKHTANT